MAEGVAAALGLLIVTAAILEGDIELAVDVQGGTGNDNNPGYRGADMAVGANNSAVIRVSGMAVGQGCAFAAIGIIGSACSRAGTMTAVATKGQS